jgi:PAS domain S-box-containing protein/diguanylate cyclase (GGDEF)-like protein
MEIGRDAHGIKSLSRHFLEQVVALSSEGILVVDAQDSSLPVVYANSAYEDLTGYSIAELAGHPWSMLRREADNDPESQRLRAAIGRAEACRITVADLRKDGSAWVVDIHVAPLTNARGEIRYFVCVHKAAVSGAVANGHEAAGASAEPGDTNGGLTLLERELGRARQKIANLDRVDPTTGLLRFGHFQETLRRDLSIARRDQRFVTLLVFEIVEFDVYRQTFGSKAADSCQRMIGAQIMRTLRRAGDLCARYDDRTLVAAVIGQTPDDVRHLVDQIADNVRQLGLHNPRGRSSRHITVRPISIGCPPGTQDDAEVLVSRALAEQRAGARTAASKTPASGRGSAAG